MFGLLYSMAKVMHKFRLIMGWVHFLANFSQTHLVTLLRICKANVLVNIALSGTDVIIFKYFRQKIWRKNYCFFAQNEAKVCKNLIITLVFEKNTIFSPKIGKNRRKL
jgi:hypothetical protein